MKWSANHSSGAYNRTTTYTTKPIPHDRSYLDFGEGQIARSLVLHNSAYYLCVKYYKYKLVCFNNLAPPVQADVGTFVRTPTLVLITNLPYP